MRFGKKSPRVHYAEVDKRNLRGRRNNAMHSREHAVTPSPVWSGTQPKRRGIQRPSNLRAMGLPLRNGHRSPPHSLHQRTRARVAGWPCLSRWTLASALYVVGCSQTRIQGPSQGGSKETLKSLADLRKTLGDEIQKLRNKLATCQRTYGAISRLLSVSRRFASGWIRRKFPEQKQGSRSSSR